MFGYVLPPADKLPQEEKERFSAVYCGLCHTLGKRYGFAARMILNYDFTFLAVLFSDGNGGAACRRCPVHPVKGCAACHTTGALETAADESVILFWWQVQDGIADHGFFAGLRYRLAALFLKRAYRKARTFAPEFDSTTQTCLARLSRLEKEGCTSMDRAADSFASLLAGAAVGEKDPLKARVLQQMLYHLGRWIYLIDAADDLKEDYRHGGYNPVALRYELREGVLTPESCTQLAGTLDASIRVIAASYELYDFGIWSPLIESIVYRGLYAVGHNVLHGTFRKKPHSKGRIPNE